MAAFAALATGAGLGLLLAMEAMGLEAGPAAVALRLLTCLAAAVALAAAPAWYAIRMAHRSCAAGDCQRARAVALRRAQRVFGAITVTFLTAGGGALLLVAAGTAPGAAAAPRFGGLATLGLTGGGAFSLLWQMLWISAARAEGPGWPLRIAADIGQALGWASLLVLATGPALGLATLIRITAGSQAADWQWILLAAPGYLVYSIGRCGLIAIGLLALSRLLSRLAPQPARATA